MCFSSLFVFVGFVLFLLSVVLLSEYDEEKPVFPAILVFGGKVGAKPILSQMFCLIVLET